MRRALGVAGVLTVLMIPSAPIVAQQTQSITVTAFVSDQRCISGDVVAVALGATADSTSEPVAYAWDFNNDGTFDTRFRTNPNAVRFYPDEVTRTVRVLARNAAGEFAQDTVTFSTLRCE
jgi:PKD repeat protein